MVSTCLRGRSLLGACLEKTEENKGGVRTCSISKTHRFSMSLPHLLSFYVQALSTIPCPNVAWSRVEPHLGSVGPSIIPLCKYLHKIDKSPCNSQKESPSMELSFPKPYTAMTRERGSSQERRKLTLGQKIREGSMRMLAYVLENQQSNFKKAN